MERNLWPPFDDIPEIRTPKTILLEQAIFLEKSTQNLLKVEVTSKANQVSGKEVIIHRFKIIAPFIGNYSFTLLTIEHDIFVYPAKVMFGLISQSYSVNNEGGLYQVLADIFKHDKTTEIIYKLLSQSKSAEKENGY